MSHRDLEGRLATVRRALGDGAPEVISQRAFDWDDAHLRRLVRLRGHDVASPFDLSGYVDDLRYTPIDVPLFLHVLPFCLRAWHDDLVGRDAEDGNFVDGFYPVLADREVFEGHLTAQQTDAVTAFMRDSILEEIDAQRGLAYVGMAVRPYRWIRAFTTYGVLRPDLGRLWDRWCQVETVGQAVAIVQVASVLAYPDGENPVFAPWERESGGGAPVLWDFGGNLYEHRWQEPNVAFLRERLSVPSVTAAVRKAAECLMAEPEGPIAARVLADLPACQARLAWRCEELPTLLATRQTPDTLLDWTL